MKKIEREHNKQIYWDREVSLIINKARALVRYGHTPEQIFTLKMDLANALAEYDSKPNGRP